MFQDKDMSFDNDIYRWYADAIVYRGFGPLIACLGIVGGTLSLLVFRRKSLRKKSCSIYFLYLALADLLCMICWLVYFVLPLYHINILTYSNLFCKIFIFAMYFAFDLANYILAVCSIDRAMSVLFPIESRKFCRSRIAHLIVFIFIIIFGVLNGHLLYGFVVLPVRMNSSQSIEHCTVRTNSRNYLEFFHIYDSYVDVIKTNMIPFVIMSVCNIIIILRVCRSNSSLNYSRKSRCRKSKRKFEKDRQLTLMLVGSVIAFLFLTLPTEINDIIRTHSPGKLVTEKDYLFSAILLSLAHLNYAVHFYIYTLTGEVFRQQLIKLRPINILWPYMLALFRCKRSSSEITDDDASLTRRQEYDNTLTPNLDISLVTTKFNDENDSFMS